VSGEVLLDKGDFVLYVIVLPILITVGIFMTGVGIAQLVGAEKNVTFLKALPVYKIIVLSLTITVPFSLMVGLCLFALVAFLILRTREVVIEL
jgi:hypothetical protein